MLCYALLCYAMPARAGRATYSYAERDARGLAALRALRCTTSRLCCVYVAPRPGYGP